jgi:hypothetical protein
MAISPIGAAASIHSEPQTPTRTNTAPQPAATPLPADTVSLSHAAQKTASGDVDRDGDSL